MKEVILQQWKLVEVIRDSAGRVRERALWTGHSYDDRQHGLAPRCMERPDERVRAAQDKDMEPWTN